MKCCAYSFQAGTFRTRFGIADDQRFSGAIFASDSGLKDTVHTKRTGFHGTTGAVDCQIAVDSGIFRYADCFAIQHTQYNTLVFAQIGHQIQYAGHFFAGHPAGGAISAFGGVGEIAVFIILTGITISHAHDHDEQHC